MCVCVCVCVANFPFGLWSVHGLNFLVNCRAFIWGHITQALVLNLPGHMAVSGPLWMSTWWLGQSPGWVELTVFLTLSYMHAPNLNDMLPSGQWENICTALWNSEWFWVSNTKLLKHVHVNRQTWKKSYIIRAAGDVSMDNLTWSTMEGYSFENWFSFFPFHIYLFYIIYSFLT